MKTGIIGLPASGKTTLFKALVGSNAQVSFDKPNIGNARVFDSNILELSNFFKPKKTTYAEITFVDIPGVPEGIENAKRRNEIFSSIRQIDAIVEVVDTFSGGSVEDKIIGFDADLIIMDLDVVERRVERLQKEKLDPGKEIEKKILEKCLDGLNSEKPIRTIGLTGEEKNVISPFGFFSIKPILYLLNVRDTDIETGKNLAEQLSSKNNYEETLFISMPVKLESELAELSEEELSEFLDSYGLNRPALPEVIEATMKILNYQTFYTVGEDEVRAWIIEKGSNARTAAGAVHTDIKRGFIAAEVISFDDFKSLNFSFKDAKSKGLLRIEGENYILKENEIVHFRFNI
jgi:GTP-binding protein YchF